MKIRHKQINVYIISNSCYTYNADYFTHCRVNCFIEETSRCPRGALMRADWPRKHYNRNYVRENMLEI
jgi:hypothetical protein